MPDDLLMKRRHDHATRRQGARRRSAASRRLRPERELLEDRLAPAVAGWSGSGALASVPAQVSGVSNATSTPASLPADAQYAVSESLGRDDPSYAISVSGDGYAAANATNQYTAYLDATGLHVATGSDSWSLTVQGVGYGDGLQALGTATSTSTANRVEYDYGGVSQWFVNGPLGLQQGFTIDARPSGSATGAPLTVGLALGGDLTATADAGGTSVTLARADGSSALGYGGLIAYDATGKAFPAHMSVVSTAEGQSLSIQVDDAGAQYPLVVDPFVQQAKLTGAPVDVSLFGYSVGMSGDGSEVIIGAKGAVVGINNGQGLAYIFSRTGATWTQKAVLTASDGVAGDALGYSVALSLDGLTAVAGAPAAKINGNTQQGAVYVFTRTGTSWGQTQKVSASDGQASDFFGTSVSISGNGGVIVAGAASAKVNTTNKQGAAYIFGKSGATWTQSKKLVAGDGTAQALFGWSVSTSSDGGTVAIGAPGQTINLNFGQGAVYLFTGSGSSWAQAARLTASDGMISDQLGDSVSISSDGSVVLAGAPFAKIGSNTNQGAAYIFTKSGAAWPQSIKLAASDGGAGDNYGASVALSSDGGTAVIGSPFADVGGKVNQGAAYVYTGSGASWPLNQKLTAGDGAANDLFGSPVTVNSSGATLLVGVPNSTIGVHFFAGSAYVFYNPMPITVTANPINQSVAVGSTVTFTAAATGSPTLSAQWQVSSDGGNVYSNIAGAVHDWFTFAPGLDNSNLKFRAVFSDGVNSTTTTAATLTVVQQSTVLTMTSNVNPRPIGGLLTFTINAASAVSGGGTPNGGQIDLYIGAVHYSGTLTNGLAVFSNIPVLGLGTYTATANYGGDATFGPATVNMTQIVVRGPSSIAGTVPTTAAFGQPVSMTGTLTYSGTTAAPTGGVMMMDGGQPIGFPQVSTVNGVTAATYTTSTLAVGDHYIQMVYLGNPETLAATSAVYHLVITAAGAGANSSATPAPVTSGASPVGEGRSTSVLGGPSTDATGGPVAQAGAAQPVTVTSNPVDQSVVLGSSVTFTASATGSPVPTVKWQASTDGGTTYGDIPGATQDWYTLSSALAFSGYKFRAVFSNGVGAPATTTAATLTVVRQSTILSVKSSINPRPIGGPLTFTVNAGGAGGGIPNGGTVNLYIGAVHLTQTLVNGVATFASVPVVALGTYTVTANYDGNANFGPAVASMTQVVSRGPSSIAGTVPTAAALGQPVSMTGTLSYSGTTAAATGGIVMMDGGQPIGFVQVATAGGVTSATYTTSTLAVGDHYIQMVYLGNPETLAATSPVYHLVVAPAAIGGRASSIASAAAGPSTSTSTSTSSNLGTVSVGATPKGPAAAASSKSKSIAAWANVVVAPPRASSTLVLQKRLSTAYKLS